MKLDVSSCIRTKRDRHILCRCIQNKNKKKTSLAITYFLHAQRTSSLVEVKENKTKQTKTRHIQALVPRSIFGFGKPPFALPSQLYKAHRTASLVRPVKENISKLAGRRWMKLNDKWGKRAEQHWIWFPSAFCSLPTQLLEPQSFQYC